MGNSKWLLTALVLSLIVNLALAGFLLGRSSSQHSGQWGTPDPAAGYFRLIGFLPEERRAELQPLIKAHFDNIRPEIRETRRHLRSMYEQLNAETLDSAKLERDLTALRQLLGTTQEASHQTFVDLVRQMSPEERQQLAEAMRRPRDAEQDRQRGTRPPPPAADGDTGS